jgi:hypothetical protein
VYLARSAVNNHKDFPVRPNAALPLAVLPLLGLGVLASGAPAPHAAPAGSVYADLAWRLVGPMRGGRTRAVAGVPGQSNVFYIGAVNGGVWKTRARPLGR